MVLLEGDLHHYGREQFSMFNLLRSPVWIFDIDHKAMYWANRSALDIWNASSLEELLARDYASDMSDATVSILMDRQQKLIRNEIVNEQWTFYPQGHPCTLDIVCSGVRIEDGRVAMLVEAEMVDHKQTVADSTVRRFEILKHLPIAVSQCTMRGELIYQNPHALQLFGSTAVENHSNHASPSPSSSPEKEAPSLDESKTQEAESVSSVPGEEDTPAEESNIILQRFVDKELGQKALQQVQEGIDFSTEAQLYTMMTTVPSTKAKEHINPPPRWFQVLLRRTRDPITSAFVILCIARDISEIVKARKQTTQAAMKSELLDVMAHEIRTPLHQIVGHLDLLLEDAGQLNPQQLESVQQIQESSSLLMSIISDLLDCSKIENGQVQIEKVAFSLKRVINGCIASMQPQAQKKGITLSGHIHPSCPPYVLSDPHRLRQILNNLLSNAVKFTEQGSVTLTVAPLPEDAESTANDTTRWRFEVTDTGIGIDVQEQKAVFERYRQANSSVARRFGGTGLGLPICQGLVELMEGTIGLRSVVGKGTTFYFELPFPIPKEEVTHVNGAPTPRPLTKTMHSSMRVLVVEDNKINQKIVQSMLQRLGHVVTLAENGQVALQELDQNQNRFHLILMDIQMPVMDGIECTKYIRNVLQLSKDKMPIVGFTAGLHPSKKAYFENEVGMNGCLGKPLPMNGLKEALMTYQPAPAGSLNGGKTLGHTEAPPPTDVHG